MRRRTIVDPRFGVRMRGLREERGLSLRDLEQPTLSSKSKLHKIETGVTAPSPETARLIDAALRAGGELLAMVRPAAAPGAEPAAGGVTTAGEPVAVPGGGDPAGSGHAAAGLREQLREGMAARGRLEGTAGRDRPLDGLAGGGAPVRRGGSGPVPDLATVVANAHLLHEVYQRADYAKAVSLLPAVLATAELLEREGTGEAQRGAHRALAQLNLAGAKLAVRLGDGPLAWILADRAVCSARLAGDPVLAAAAAVQTACALLRMPGRLDDAADALAAASDERAATGAPRGGDDLSVRGAFCLLGAVVAARQADRATALRRLAEAEALAGWLGADGNHLWTGFGPTNVLIHRAGVAVQLRDPRAAVEVGGRIDTRRLPPPLASRRARVHLDLAAAFAQLPDGDPPAVLHLLAAERIAPQLLGVDHTGRALLELLTGRERRAATPGLRSLAQRAGVLG